MNAQHNFSKLGKRRCARIKLGVIAELKLSSGSLPCQVVDVSRTGASLQSEGRLHVGLSAMLKLAEIEALGTIVWRRGAHLGLRFDRLLNPEQVEQILWISQHHDDFELSKMTNSSSAWR